MAHSAKPSEQNKKLQVDSVHKDKLFVEELTASHLAELQKIKEESIAREQKFARDLDARYVEELRKLHEETVVKEKQFKIELNTQYSQRLKEVQALNIEREQQLLSDFETRLDQVVNKLQKEYVQRENDLLEQWKTDHELQINDLLTALIAIRTGRNKIISAVSWIAIAALMAIGTTGYMQGELLTVLVLGALIGFSVAIIFAGKNNKYNTEHLRSALKEGRFHSIALDPDYGRAIRFFFVGMVSLFILGISGFLIFLGKGKIQELAKPSLSPAHEATSTSIEASNTNAEGPSTFKAPAEVENPQPVSQPGVDATANLAGNGGNFTGGVSK